MENYVNITLDITLISNRKLDLSIPQSMTLKEMLHIVLESYRLEEQLDNPVARIVQTGEVLLSTSKLERLKNSLLLRLESI